MVESEVKECKTDLFGEKEKMRKMSLKISRLKLDLERASRWTKSSRIINNLSGRVHNERAGIGFHKQTNITEDIYYLCGKLGHPTTKCPVAAKCRNRSTLLSKGNNYKPVLRNRFTNLLPHWEKRNLIHPFYHKKGPKLVWVPKTNLWLLSRIEWKEARKNGTWIVLAQGIWLGIN